MGLEAEREAAILSRMIEIRRHLHRFPELSNEERETQAYLRRVLEEAGLDDIRPVAGFGLAVDIIGLAGRSDRLIVLRADIDALPIDEETGLEFRSTRAGVMHACGHDAHAAMGVAAALVLHASRRRFRGTVRVIFQPAEETEPLGAKRIVAEGLLDDADAAIALHVDPSLASGAIAVAPGPYTLANDVFDAVVTGRPTHAAKPGEGVDAITVACAMVSELQKIVSREVDAFDPAVISVTGIHGGGIYNILASSVSLLGTIRTASKTTRALIHERMEAILNAVAQAHNASVKLDIRAIEPAVVNDERLAAVVSECAADIVGRDRCLPLPGWPVGDDFSFYGEICASVYFRLGVRNEAEESVYPLHHPRFRVDEAAMPIGVRMLVRCIEQLLGVPK